jgi:predicted RNA binding protein YcfA (HicA-like mRNA interferase family)
MVRKYPSLSVGEVRAILTARGFTLVRTSGSHEQWAGEIGGKKRMVSVDTHGDFGIDLIKSMIRQSGLTREQFYCSTDKTAKRINKKLDPELRAREEGD